MLVFVGVINKIYYWLSMIYEPLEPTTQPTNQQPRSPHPSNGPRLGSWITSWHSKPPGNQHIPPLLGKFGTSSTQTYRLGVGDHICEFPRRVKNKKNKKKHFFEKPPEKHLSRNIFWSKPFPRASGITYCATHTAQRAWIFSTWKWWKKIRSWGQRLTFGGYLPQQICPGIVGPSEIIKDSLKKTCPILFFLKLKVLFTLRNVSLENKSTMSLYVHKAKHLMIYHAILLFSTHRS